MAAGSAGILDELKRRQKDAEPVRCPIAKAMRGDHLTEEQKEGLQVALGNPDEFYATVIAELLTDKGVRCGEKAVRNHRKNLCGCARG